jgi:hypothetical protein
MTQLEERLQEDCYLWFHNTHPSYRGLLCYNLNNSANRIQGAKNKGMGLQSGRSDMVFYFNSRAYMIEMKTEDGSQSPDQIKWEKLIKAQGFNYIVVRSKQEFILEITKIING